jgi:aspartate/methionine/tyrosine aminotransferase
VDARTALEAGEDVFVINSFSKYFQMTGWRMGWLVAPPAYVREIEKLAQNLFISPSAIAQHAALACFLPQTIEIVEQRRRELDARRKYLIPALESIGFGIPVCPKVRSISTRTARSSRPTASSSRAASHRAGVAVTPGKDFGHHEPERHIRIAYTQPVARLEEAVARIRQLLARS